MTRINRAAWQRIKERVAEPKAVTVFKGRSVGATFGVIENMRRFSIEKLFARSDDVSRVVGEIERNINERATR